MPNRILKESICYSDDLDKLSSFEETVFYRLMVRADDFGRMDARASYLKSMLFVTKKGITEKNVADAVSKLASVGLVRLYEVDGKPFLLFPKWNLHQRLRNSKEKYPAPQNGEDFNNSPQLAATCRELRPESESQSESQSEYEYESKNTRKRVAFQKPTMEELTAYCLENNLRIDVQAFLDYYDSNGWIVGKTKMKDWRATARNWSRKDFNHNSKKTTPQSASYDIEEFDRRGFNIPKLD